MKTETRNKLISLSTGEMFTILWADIPANWARPKHSAILKMDGKTFEFQPLTEGLQVTRLK